MSKGGGSIPQTYTHTLRFGSTGETIRVDADLDNIHVKELPKIFLDAETRSDVKVSVEKMPRIEFAVKELPRVEFSVKELPTVNFALKEIPSVRAHVPSHYDYGLCVFGLEVLRFSLCGETQVITEKYIPRAAEECR
jgi:hypothetical protein